MGPGSFFEKRKTEIRTLNTLDKQFIADAIPQQKMMSLEDAGIKTIPPKPKRKKRRKRKKRKVEAS